MDLDNLKEIWSQEEFSEIPEVSLEKQQEISSPIEKIKRNIRFEIWSFIPVFPIAIFGLFKLVNDEKLLLYSVVFVVVMAIVSFFFYFKIYKFYKEISNNSLKTHQHLLELEYQIKYFRDLYQSYYIAFVPILLSEFFVLFQFSKSFNQLSIESMIGVFVISLFLGFVFLFLCWKLWYHFFYGKYARQIEKAIADLKS